MFKKATRKKLRARIALEGPAGSGKSYTALRFAFALAGKGGRVAVIDTEHGSASKYVGESPDGFPWNFDVVELEHFAPTAYTGVTKEAGRQGYDVLIIDSWSHAWQGLGGALDIVDRKAKTTKGGKFAAWGEVTPMQLEMIEAILASPCHVIVTMRTKMEYVMEEVEEKGKKKTIVSKVGTKPIQRDGVEYEFDVVGDMDLEQMIIISKTRCPALKQAKAIEPGPMFIAPFIDWLGLGEDVPETSPEASPPSSVAPIAEPPRQGVRLDGKQAPINEYVGHDSDPCGDVIAEQIKTKAQAARMPLEKLLEILARHGATKVAEMPRKPAEKLLGMLQMRAMEEEIPF